MPVSPLPSACSSLTCFLLAITSLGAYFLNLDLKRFAAGFTVIFGLSYLCWTLGHFAYLAATPDKRAGLGLTWSLGLTGEAGYIVALVAGLVIANFLPGFTTWLKEASRAEWFIKTAIVILARPLA